MKDGSILLIAGLIVDALGIGPVVSAARDTAFSVPVSVEAQNVLDAAGPKQRESLDAVYLIACPGVGFGSGFLIDSGVIVTNAHVVGPCTERNLVGISITNENI